VHCKTNAVILCKLTFYGCDAVLHWAIVQTSTVTRNISARAATSGTDASGSSTRAAILVWFAMNVDRARAPSTTAHHTANRCGGPRRTLTSLVRCCLARERRSEGRWSPAVGREFGTAVRGSTMAISRRRPASTAASRAAINRGRSAHSKCSSELSDAPGLSLVDRSVAQAPSWSKERRKQDIEGGESRDVLFKRRFICTRFESTDKTRAIEINTRRAERWLAHRRRADHSGVCRWQANNDRE